MKTLTVISPVYNEVDVIGKFHQELKSQLAKVKGRYKSKILFILDRSPDGTLGVLKGIAKKDKSVQVLSLSSRFGHQMSLLAGIDHADSDAVIMMDCDLQHPPEVIHDLLRQSEKGNDVVYAVRTDTEDIGFFKKAATTLFYRIINSMSSIPINENAADFRLVSRPVLKVLQEQIRERNVFLRGIISWIGFNQVPVHYSAKKRGGGRSKYSLSRLMSLAVFGILSFSKKPLQAAILLGCFFALLAFVNGIITVVLYLRHSSFPAGWATLAVLLSGFTGVQLIFLGIIGEYIGGIFDEVKGRPHYIVEEKINLR